MIRLSNVCLFLSLLSLILSTSAPAASIKGKATDDAGSVAGVEVMAYPADVLTFSAPPAYTSTKTSADGFFSLELPEGQYYLLARGEHLFTYYGRNPVTAPPNGLEDVNL